MTSEVLLLDPAIRDWVVLPMVALMVLMGLCRHHATQLLKSTQILDASEIEQKQILTRCGRLRHRGQFLPATSFQSRKSFFVAKDTGVLQQKVTKSGTNPMTNPLGMVDHMKGNMLYMIPNMMMMGVISFFFQGFVLVKVPFPLTARFKVMLQRGIDLATLDVSYVSSLSWYFLTLFGLRGLFKILLGEDSDALDESRATQMQMGVGLGSGPGNVFDAPAAYKHEREELQLTKHSWILEDSELKLLGPTMAGRIVSSSDQRGGASTTRPPSSTGGKKATRVKKIRKKVQ